MKTYTIRVSYSVEVTKESNDSAIRDASYAVPSTARNVEFRTTRIQNAAPAPEASADEAEAEPLKVVEAAPDIPPAPAAAEYDGIPF